MLSDSARLRSRSDRRMCSWRRPRRSAVVLAIASLKGSGGVGKKEKNRDRGRLSLQG